LRLGNTVAAIAANGIGANGIGANGIGHRANAIALGTGGGGTQGKR
jgi:hypothetical protein